MAISMMIFIIFRYLFGADTGHPNLGLGGDGGGGGGYQGLARDDEEDKKIDEDTERQTIME